MRILSSDDGDSLTINQLLERTHGRGIWLVFIILSLPFALWMPLPGMSIVLGLVIALLSLRVAFAGKPRLPSWFGNRRISPKLKRVILGGGMKLCRLLEKISRPRRTHWMTWRATRTFHALLITVLALLLALPLPPVPFFGSNALPGYAIILLATSMMEEDGALVWLGYAACIANAAYFLILGGLIITHLGQWIRALRSTFIGTA